jgi:hypothetical protein
MSGEPDWRVGVPAKDPKRTAGGRSPFFDTAVSTIRALKEDLSPLH